MRHSIVQALGLLLAIAALTGCSSSSDSRQATVETHAAKADHSHEGWWCDEHGVPEEVCALCDSKIAGDFQRRGDWCNKHDRPDSQCFICHPEFEARFAAQYEAKYGKQPPKPEGIVANQESPEAAVKK